jgi:PPK2 family polyphosphate:nucleotide phosphotransferase
MKIETKRYLVGPDSEIHLKKWPTQVDSFYDSKEEYQELLSEHVTRLSALQGLLYASSSYSLLLIFQAMDAAGKDGAIKHVMSGIDPQGCEVFTFKRPSTQDLKHDFLWRAVCRLPERGRIGIFNRSYYEEVLVVRVHPDILHRQGIPEHLLNKKTVWRERYKSIADFEEHLSKNGTRIIKFYLHVSKDEQRKRLVERIDNPEKNWKFSYQDVEERALWKEYMSAYEKCLGATSSKEAPWYIIPADDKKNARLIISQVILETLDGLNMHYPETTPERHEELLEIRKRLLE